MVRVLRTDNIMRRVHKKANEDKADGGHEMNLEVQSKTR